MLLYFVIWGTQTIQTHTHTHTPLTDIFLPLEVDSVIGDHKIVYIHINTKHHLKFNDAYIHKNVYVHLYKEEISYCI